MCGGNTARAVGEGDRLVLADTKTTAGGDRQVRGGWCPQLFFPDDVGVDPHVDKGLEPSPFGVFDDVLALAEITAHSSPA